jgi:hypothetical protein
LQYFTFVEGNCLVDAAKFLKEDKTTFRIQESRMFLRLGVTNVD